MVEVNLRESPSSGESSANLTFGGSRRGQFGSEPLVPFENALELADAVPKDCLACTALYRNGGGSNSQRNLLKPKIVISHLGGSDHRSEGQNEETRNGRGCGRKTSSSATGKRRKHMSGWGLVAPLKNIHFAPA